MESAEPTERTSKLISLAVNANMPSGNQMCNVPLKDSSMKPFKVSRKLDFVDEHSQTPIPSQTENLPQKETNSGKKVLTPIPFLDRTNSQDPVSHPSTSGFSQACNAFKSPEIVQSKTALAMQVTGNSKEDSCNGSTAALPPQGSPVSISPAETSTPQLHRDTCSLKRKHPDSASSDDVNATLSQSDYSFENATALPDDWVKAQLLESNDGRLVLKWYEDREYLSMKKRSVLAKILVDKDLNEDPSKKISSDRFQAMARAICKFFPSEDETTWFVPYFTDLFGKSHNAKGKLYDRWVNVRRNFRKEGLILGRGASQESQRIDDADDPVLSADILEKIQWLMKKAEPLNEVTDAFRLTCSARLMEFEKNPIKDIYKYVTLYPALKQPDGYVLIENDFETVFPGKSNLLLTKWKSISTSIINHSVRLLQDSSDFRRIIQSLKLDITTLSEDTQSTVALFVLPLLARTITVKKTWRPSKLEAKAGFFIHAESVEEADQQIIERNNRLDINNVSPQPVPVAVGSIDSRMEYYVSLRDIIYPCQSALMAVDICCKLFLLLKTHAPPDSLISWLFLETYVFDISSDNEIRYPSLKTLKNDLKLETIN